jgi:hypothetical protein
MFRSFFRVVVVAVVVLSFTLSLAQVAQARPRDVRQEAVGVAAEDGWFEVALKWIGRLIGVENQDGKKPPIHLKGSCIDPWGYERPCS